MKKFAVVLSVLFFSVFALAAFEDSSVLFSHLSEKEMNTLKSGESLVARTRRNQSVYNLTPNGSEAYRISYEASKAEHSFMVGTLQFIEYPKEYENLTEEEIILDVYNRTLRISTMKGIKYSSYTAGDKMKTLFSDAHLIEDPKKHSAVDDKVVSEVVPFAHYYAYITDTKFGSNVYTADYRVSDDEILVEVSNYDKIKYMGVKCIDARNLHMYIDVKFMDEGISVCSFAVAYDTDVDVKVLFTTVALDGAFIRRINSLKDWFIERMSE